MNGIPQKIKNRQLGYSTDFHSSSVLCSCTARRLDKKASLFFFISGLQNNNHNEEATVNQKKRM